MLTITTLAAVAALSGGGAMSAMPQAAPQAGPRDARHVQQQQQQRGAPRGSYSRSCSDAYVNRGRLYAECRDSRNRTYSTSIQLDRCGNHDISNIEGRLTCGPHRGDIENGQGGGRPGGPGGPGGGGGWGGRASITVFIDADYRGASATFDSEMANLGNTGFNDQISSMRLRGEWEVCTDAYFRGNCQIIDGDVSNLSRLGLNDRISSLRPVRRGGGRW